MNNPATSPICTFEDEPADMELFIDTDYTDINLCKSDLDTNIVDVILCGVKRLSENKPEIGLSQKNDKQCLSFESELCDISNNEYVLNFCQSPSRSIFSNNFDISDNSGVLVQSLNIQDSDNTFNANTSKKTNYCERIELEGRRIVDVQHFIDSLIMISNHAPQFGCSLQNLKIIKETKRGLASKITFKCNMCMAIETIKTVSDYEDVNNSAVLGITNVGSGYTHLAELHSTLNIPTFSSRTFDKIQENIADLWEETAMEEMAKAAEEEKELAIECGDVTADGTPLVTVVCDGVWAKRSYRSNYNSMSGAAAIVGFKTKKVLYLSVRNKFCLTCQIHPDNTPQHKCYKNWHGSSSAM